MKSREKIPTTKKEVEENENSLTAFKKREDQAMQEDQTHPRAWEHIDPDKLIPECQEVFDLYKKGIREGNSENLSLAIDLIAVINAKIEKIKNVEVKDSNDRFVKWIDNIVRDARGTVINKEELAK